MLHPLITNIFTMNKGAFATCTIFAMFHNTAYAIPSGYDARKPVKTLKPLVYTRLSSFLVIVLELRNFSHFKSESAERKQKIVV